MTTLIIIDSSGREREIEVGSKPMVFGRAEDCDVILGSRSVSRHHLKCWEEDGCLMIEDLTDGSSLTIDGEPVTGIFELAPGTEMESGVFTFTLPGGDLGAGLDSGPVRAAILLKGIKGAVKGIEIELEQGDNDIGRDPEMFVVIDDPSISRQHARVQVSGSQATLIDMRSSNGTYLNGKRVETAVLESGDLVRIGKLQFRYECGPLTSLGAKKQRRKRLLMFGTGGMLGLFLLLGISAKLCTRPPPPPVVKPPKAHPDPIHQQVELHMTTTKAHVQNKNWKKALAEVNAALELHPICAECRALKERVESEIMTKGRYEECRVNFELSEWKKALECFRHIPQKSVYYQSTKYKMAECVKHLSSHHLAEGKGFFHARHYDKAHAHFVKYMKLNPCDKRIFDQYVTPIQRRLRRNKQIKKIQFTCSERMTSATKKVDPLELIAAKYTNHMIRTAMVTYHAGKIQKSLDYLRRISLQYANQEVGELADELEAQIKVVRGTNKEAISALMRGDLRAARKAIQTVFRYDAALMPNGVSSHHRNELSRQMAEWLYKQGLEDFSRQNFVNAYHLWIDCHQNYASDATCKEGLLQLEKEAEKKLQQAKKYEHLGDVRAFRLWQEVMKISRPESIPYRTAKQKMVEYDRQ